MSVVKNVLGTNLEPCCDNPLTGFFRDGYCSTSPEDHGVHTVCALITDEFLEYSKAQGNDLSTANPRYGFPGLKAGDKIVVEGIKSASAPGVFSTRHKSHCCKNYCYK